jgi:hypothetical protein
MLRSDRGSTKADGLLWVLRHITGIATKRQHSRECLNHVIVLGGRHLRWTLKRYVR